MADLYNILLKNTENISFGANAISIIAPKNQGEIIVKSKKLLVTYDGEEQEPIVCQSVTVKYEDDTIMLNIVLTKDDEKQAEAVPQAEAVIPTSKTDVYTLQGDDLESFEMLSSFRKSENCIQKTNNSELEIYVLKSGTFDIQDISSIENAMLDIVAKEQQLIDSGYKVFNINTPKFDYENNNNFKLIESAELIKQSIEVVEENK